MSPPLSYRSAGVDIDEATRALASVRGLIGATHGAEVVPLRAGFAGAFRLRGTRRILLASMDGVGTKLRVAIRLERYGSVGGDLVRHSANDILVHGGRPLFFLDYVGTSALRAGWFHEVLGGVAAACRDLGCALLGGETAEMPGIYHGDDFDLVGTIIGDVDEGHLLDGSRIEPGDVLLALGSDGLHTNGYSLARKILAQAAGDDLEAQVPGGSGESWGDALLWPHRSYGGAVMPLVEAGRLHGMAHVTGGGIAENLARVLPAAVDARVALASWTPPNLFRTLARLGEVPAPELFRAFNMGVGFILVVSPGEAGPVLEELRGAGERAWRLGEIVAGEGRAMLDGIEQGLR